MAGNALFGKQICHFLVPSVLKQPIPCLKDTRYTPWYVYHAPCGTFGANGAMENRTQLKCFFGGIRTHAPRKSALNGKGAMRCNTEVQRANYVATGGLRRLLWWCVFRACSFCLARAMRASKQYLCLWDNAHVGLYPHIFPVHYSIVPKYTARHHGIPRPISRLSAPKSQKPQYGIAALNGKCGVGCKIEASHSHPWFSPNRSWLEGIIFWDIFFTETSKNANEGRDKIIIIPSAWILIQHYQARATVR